MVQNALIKEYKGIKEEHSTMRQEMAQMKGQMDKVAAVEKMELLAVVVEEQRLRLDSVIQGSTKIYPIFKELKRMDTSLKEVEQFLSLPQPRRLHEHLQEMTTLMEDLSQRLVELSADVHTQQANKVDTLVSRTDAIGKHELFRQLGDSLFVNVDLFVSFLYNIDKNRGESGILFG